MDPLPSRLSEKRGSGPAASTVAPSSTGRRAGRRGRETEHHNAPGERERQTRSRVIRVRHLWDGIYCAGPTSGGGDSHKNFTI